MHQSVLLLLLVKWSNVECWWDEDDELEVGKMVT